MPNRLARTSSRVNDYAKTGSGKLILLGKTIGKAKQPAKKRSLHFFRFSQRNDVFGGDDKKMRRGLRVDVFKGKQAFRLSNDFCGDLA